MIDKAHIEVEGGFGDDGHGTRAYLVIDGDVVEQCERYLGDDGSLFLPIGRKEAEELHKSLGEVLFGG